MYKSCNLSLIPLVLSKYSDEGDAGLNIIPNVAPDTGFPHCQGTPYTDHRTRTQRTIVSKYKSWHLKKPKCT